MPTKRQVMMENKSLTTRRGYQGNDKNKEQKKQDDQKITIDSIR